MELKNPRSRTPRSGILGDYKTNRMSIPVVWDMKNKAGSSSLIWAGAFSCCNLMTMSL